MANLVKDAKAIRLPKVTGSVERILRQVNQKAKQHRWRKIVVVGEGPHGYMVSNSKMKYYELIGFIEYAKKIIIDEVGNDG